MPLTKTFCTHPWIIPGLTPDEQRPEALRDAVKRVFGEDPLNHCRKIGIIYARHFFFYAMERMDSGGRITEMKRGPNRDNFKYGVYEIERCTGFDHASILFSSKTCINLMQTDRKYRVLCEIILRKIEQGYIIMPELVEA